MAVVDVLVKGGGTEEKPQHLESNMDHELDNWLKDDEIGVLSWENCSILKLCVSIDLLPPSLQIHMVTVLELTKR